MQGLRLIRAGWADNHGLLLTYQDRNGVESRRFVGPRAVVTVAEAALALRTYPLLLYRMIRLRRLKATGRPRQRRVAMSEVYRLKAAWARAGGVASSRVTED